MRKKHKHLFIHIGGGCRIQALAEETPYYPCDDEYKCRCGEKKKIYSSYKQHLENPKKMGLKKIKLLDL